MTISNMDLPMMHAYLQVARTGKEIRIKCADEKEPYQMRFRWYKFLKRVRNGTSQLTPTQAVETLEAQTGVMIVVSGRDFVLQSRANLPGMQQLLAQLEGVVQEGIKQEADELAAMGERLLAGLNSDSKPAAPASNQYLDKLYRKD